MPRHRPAAIRRARLLARTLGALAGVVVGVYYAAFVVSNSPEVFASAPGQVSIAKQAALGGGALVGAVALALAGPLLTVEPYLWLERVAEDAPAGEVLGALGGIIAGLLIAALVAVLLAPVPYGIGAIASTVLALGLVTIGARTGTRRRQQFGALLRPGGAARGEGDAAAVPLDGRPVVVDTSALIDGRIVDIARAGFVPGRLLIAGFVLEELQRVADAGDPQRRARGRRGLESLEALRSNQDVVVETVATDFTDTPEVDSRLLRLALERGALLLTSDYNLNRIAAVAGVRVLNVNDLANAMKPPLTAGETFAVSIVKEGKEAQQGVGYLDDGTMVVVENARQRLGTTVRATVTSVLQTSAGRMVFATSDGDRAMPGHPLRPRAAQR
ncbi:MAG: TRAM domain-containing protein [Candidatus Dormibacteria bacterium]